MEELQVPYTPVAIIKKKFKYFVQTFSLYMSHVNKAGHTHALVLELNVQHTL